MKINRRCRWCGIRLPLLRALLGLWYCPKCAPYTNDAGIYLQSGPPPWSHNSRVDGHHGPREQHPVAPQRAGWFTRLTCQHCWHLAVSSGAFCCECGAETALGLPVDKCVVCQPWRETEVA